KGGRLLRKHFDGDHSGGGTLGTLRDKALQRVERLLRLRRRAAVARALGDRRPCRVEQRKFTERWNTAARKVGTRSCRRWQLQPRRKKNQVIAKVDALTLERPSPDARFDLGVRGVLGRELS